MLVTCSAGWLSVSGSSPSFSMDVGTVMFVTRQAVRGWLSVGGLKGEVHPK